MEWFKHKTSAHIDPVISDAWDEFGDCGYVIWFVLLEVYGQQYNSSKPDKKLNVSQAFLRRKFRKSWSNVRQVLDFYATFGKIQLETDGKRVSIGIPKFTEILSNWTLRQTNKPTEAPTEAPTAKTREDKDKDKDKDISSEQKSSEPAFIEIPLVGKNGGAKSHQIYQSDLTEWKALYPGVDIPSEIKKLVGWNIGNPTRRKTSSGITRHIHAWLAKAQNTNASKNENRSHSKVLTPEQLRALNE